MFSLTLTVIYLGRCFYPKQLAEKGFVLTVFWLLSPGNKLMTLHCKRLAKQAWLQARHFSSCGSISPWWHHCESSSGLFLQYCLEYEIVLWQTIMKYDTHFDTAVWHSVGRWDWAPTSARGVMTLHPNMGQRWLTVTERHLQACIRHNRTPPPQTPGISPSPYGFEADGRSRAELSRVESGRCTSCFSRCWYRIDWEGHQTSPSNSASAACSGTAQTGQGKAALRAGGKHFKGAASSFLFFFFKQSDFTWQKYKLFRG